MFVSEPFGYRVEIFMKALGWMSKANSLGIFYLHAFFKSSFICIYCSLVSSSFAYQMFAADALQKNVATASGQRGSDRSIAWRYDMTYNMTALAIMKETRRWVCRIGKKPCDTYGRMKIPRGDEYITWENSLFWTSFSQAIAGIVSMK